ncbi:MAG: hypothetical protein ACREQF_00655 [Candidatus Binataceae bacterium]
MAAEKNGDLIEAMLAPRLRGRAAAPADAEEAPAELETRRVERRLVETPPTLGVGADVEGRIEVRPIGTRTGFAELAALHKKTWSNLNVREKQVHALLWPLALHFGLYLIRPGEERRRPRLIAAFWARCLADSPLTLGHLYPPQLFKGLRAIDVWEFGGMVVEPAFQHRGLMRTLTDTARLFLFSRRPKLMITNPVEPLYELYRQFGMKTVGNAPVEHPHAENVRVWLMYGKFDDLSKPYFM